MIPGPNHSDVQLTPDEERLIDHAEAAIVKYNKMRHSRGHIDTLYSFVLSDSGRIHDGASFEPGVAHATVCGERCAIANMVLQESYSARIRGIVVADPVPALQERGTPPCGTCRHVIWLHGTPETTVLLLQYIQGVAGWTFPKLEKLTIGDLYPLPFVHAVDLWDNWQPK